MIVTEVSANTGRILDGFRTLLHQDCDKILPEARQGTVAEMTEHFALYDFLNAKKKTQAMRALPRLSDAAFGKSGKQNVQVISLQFRSNNCCCRLGEEIVYRKWRGLSCIVVSVTRVSRLATEFWGFQVVLLWME